MDFFLQILGLAYFVFALWNLRLAVLLLPLFFPAYLLKFELAGIPFPLIEVLIFGTFLAWLLQSGWKFMKGKLSWKDLVEPYKKSWWLAVLGILAAALLSVFITPQSVVMMDGNTVFYGRKVAMGILKSWIIVPVLMLALFSWVVKGAEDARMLLDGYAASAVFLSAWAVYQVLTGQYITPDARASGPFNSANYLALYIAPAFFYALVRLKEFLILVREPWWKKILHFFRHPADQRAKFFSAVLWTVGTVILFFALFFTKSYAAFLALLTVFAVWFVFHARGWKSFPWKWVFWGAGLTVLVVAALIAADPVKWQQFFQLAERSSSGVRVEIYTIALRLIAENPLQGIGLGMFPAAYQLEGPRILGHDPYEWNMLHPHNVFLAFWLNLGLLGLSSFLWIVKDCFKNWRFVKICAQSDINTPGWFQGIGLLLFLIVLLHGLVDTPFFKNDLSLLFWLIVATVLLPAAVKKQD